MGRKGKKFEKLCEEEMTKLPGPLYSLVSQYLEESEPFKKVHRLIDAFEWAVKWHTVLAVSELMQGAAIPDKMKAVLAGGLRTPSLGVWLMFFREAVESLEAPLLPYAESERLLELEKKHQIVSFRNGYAHGATPSDEECRKDIQEYHEVLMQLIGSELFTDVELIISGTEGSFVLRGSERRLSSVKLEAGRSAAVTGSGDTSGGDTIGLWPLGISALDEKTGEWRFFYFNADKSNKIERLNYETPSIGRDKELHEPFYSIFPIKEWTREIEGTHLEQFRERIEQLTEIFKGRTEERKRLKEYLLEGRGLFMIWGEPGIGKSALLAQVFHEAKAGAAPEDTEGLGARIEYPPIIEYFIRRSYDSAKEEFFFRHLSRRFDEIYGLKGIPIGRSVDEQRENLQRRLDAVSQLEEPRRCVIFVDGLDENPHMGRSIPDPRQWLAVITSSRPVKELSRWWADRYRDGHKEELELDKLSLQDIRAILYEAVDKYDKDFTDDYLAEVAGRSQGNPNYLRLLVEKIISENGKPGNIDGIPENISKLYAQTVDRLTDSGRDQGAYDLLILLAEAKASLPVPAIQEFLGLPNGQQAQAAVDVVRELLFEDPATPDVEDYQLYHESLREWLQETKKIDCRKIARKLTDYCYAYGERESDEAKEYALYHAAAHLHSAGDRERLWQLMRDEEYRRLQINGFYRYQPSMDSLRHAMELYVEQDGKEPDDDAKLSWLVLRAGELGEQAKRDIEPAFEWMRNDPLEDPARIERALQRLEVLDEKKFFLANILLLWIEADRQVELPEEERIPEYARRILEAVEERVPEGSGTVDWSDFLSPEFMAWWFDRVLDVFSYETIPGICKIGMRTEDRNISNLIVYLLKREKNNIELMIVLSESILDEKNKSKVLGKVAVFSTNGGDHERALKVADTIDDMGEKAYSLGKIAEALAHAGEREQSKMVFDRALTTASSIEGESPRAEALGEMGEALAHAGEWDQSELVFERALETAEIIDDVGEKAYAFRKIAQALARAGKQEQSKMVFNQAVSAASNIEDEEYRAFTLREIAETMDSAGERKQAEEVFDRALETAESIDDVIYKMNALKEIAESLAHVGEHGRALEIAESIDDANDKAYALGEIAEALAHVGEQEKAGALFERALSSAMSIKYGFMRSGMLGKIAESLAHMGEHDRALETAEGIEDVNDKAKALGEIAEALANAGGQEQAKTVFERALSPDSSNDEEYITFTFREIAETMARAGEREQAEAVFDRALERAESIDDVNKKARALGELAEALARTGDRVRAETVFERSLSTLDNIEYDFFRSDLLKEIAVAMIRVGEQERALDAVGGINDVNDKADALGEIAEALAHAGERIQAEKVFEQALTTAVSSEDNHDKSIALRKIAEALVRVGEQKQALETVDNIDDGMGRARVLGKIAESLGRKGEIERAKKVFDRALETADSIEADHLRSMIFGEIVEALTHVGEHERALGIIESIDDVSDQVDALGEIAKALADAEKREQAESVFERALEKAASINDVEEKDRALGAIAESLAQAGEYIRALEIAARIDDGYDKADALRRIAKILTKTHDFAVFNTYLQSFSASNEVWESLLPEWQELLVTHSTNPFELLRQSFIYHPFNTKVATSGIYSFLIGLLRTENMDLFYEIIRHCPQLELDFLLPQEESAHIKYSYSDYESWIDTVEDEDDREQIELWARRVEKGKLSEEEFEQEVRDLFQ